MSYREAGLSCRTSCCPATNSRKQVEQGWGTMTERMGWCSRSDNTAQSKCLSSKGDNGVSNCKQGAHLQNIKSNLGLNTSCYEASHSIQALYMQCRQYGRLAASAINPPCVCAHHVCAAKGRHVQSPEPWCLKNNTVQPNPVGRPVGCREASISRRTFVKSDMCNLCTLRLMVLLRRRKNAQSCNG